MSAASFFCFDGWNVPVLVNTAQENRTAVGRDATSWTGRPSRRQYAVASEWSFECKIERQDWIDTLECIIEGRGHYCPFDFDAWSALSGVGPELPASGEKPPVTYELSGTGRFGHNALHLKDTKTVAWDFKLHPGKWTASYWRNLVDTSQPTDRVTVRSDGGKWLNGSRNDALDTSELSVGVNGVLQFENTQGHDIAIDGLYVLNCVACFEFIEESYTWQAANDLPMSSLPALRIEGTSLGRDRRVEVMGRIGQHGFVQHGSSAGWVNNARTLQFTLKERNPTLRKPPVKSLASYRFDPLYYGPSGSVSYKELSAGYAAGLNTNATHVVGPFGYGSAKFFTDSSPHLVQLPADLGFALAGATGVSFLVWLKRSVTTSPQTILDLVFAGGGIRFRATLATGNIFFLEGRAADGDTLQTHVGGTANTDIEEWHQVGAVMDLKNSVFRTVFDGAVDSESVVKVFSATTMSNETGSPAAHVGETSAGIQALRGSLAGIQVFRGAVTPGMAKRHYELGREGILT